MLCKHMPGICLLPKLQYTETVKIPVHYKAAKVPNLNMLPPPTIFSIVGLF